MKVIRTDGVLHFDAQTIWQGIVFHLRQPHRYWSYIDRITPDSLLYLRDRLTAQHIELIISRDYWAELTDDERLVWLLTGSHTTFIPVAQGSHTVELLIDGRPKTS